MDTGALSPTGRQTAARTSSRIGERAEGFQVNFCDRKYRLRPACQETERGMEQLKCEGRIDCIGGTRAQVGMGAV